MAALLAQQTSQAYSKVIMKQLQQQILTTPETLNGVSTTQLTEHLRASDLVSDEEAAKKAIALKQYSQWYVEQGGFDALAPLDMLALRNALLTIKAIAMDKETADLILLYAFQRPAFIIDEDTRRIFYRLELINGDEPHDELRHLMSLFLDQDADLFNEYHALLVHHARKHCRQEPQCKSCPLDDICPE